MSYISGKYALTLESEDIKVISHFDKQFLQISENVREVVSPSIISGFLLRRFGYFSTYPHYLNGISLLKEAFSSSDGCEHSGCEHSGQYLLPAACLNIYPLFKGRKNVDDEIVTTRPRVFRYEGEIEYNSTRLWEFEVREFVFLGSHEFVKNQLKIFSEKALELAREVYPDATLINATDHFYDSKVNRIKKGIQIKNKYKQELVIPVNEKDVAVASFNFHETHFSKPMNFDREGEVVTGCVGFGLERWLAAFKAHGAVVEEQ